MAAFIDENQQFIDPDTSAPIVNGNIFFGEQGGDPKLLPITVFVDRGFTTTIKQPIKTDASGRPVQKIFIPGRYSFVVQNSAGSQKLIDDDAGSAEAVGVTTLTNITGANTITAQADPVLTALLNGEQFTFTAVAINTDKMTLNIDGLGAKAIKFNFNEEMAPGFIQQNQTVNLTYNSTGDNFVWDNEGRGISLLTNVAGDGNTITADGGPSITGYVDKQIYNFRAKFVNTGAVTLKIGTLPVISIKKNHNEALQAGDIQVNQDVIVVFNATLGSGTFQVISQLSLVNQFFIKSKMIIPFFGTNATIPSGFVLCDGNNSTPNLLDKFIKGTSTDGLNVGATGGSTTTGPTTLTIAQMPSHNHSNTSAALAGPISGGNPPGIVRGSANTGNTGGGGSHTHPGNEPPFLRLIWIMKT